MEGSIALVKTLLDSVEKVISNTLKQVYSSIDQCGTTITAMPMPSFPPRNTDGKENPSFLRLDKGIIFTCIRRLEAIKRHISGHLGLKSMLRTGLALHKFLAEKFNLIKVDEGAEWV